ncbi:hypothetical protein K7432_015722 [Basidiobolus ranarum]|uniref:Pentatricopeptide repeat-containing protein n=1 Tax=Basidiobolus ranarum TaxID=34480 RepID=A0ABR2VMN7_9FUNG
MPHLRGVNVNAIRKKTGVSEKELIEHWSLLVEEIETSRATLDEECYNLYLSGYGCMNLLDSKKYPIDHVKELLVSAPKKNLSPGLETYQAAMASYARTGEFADSPKLRLQRVLEINQVMVGKGLECDSTTFHHMFEACLPHQIFAYGPEANINSFKYANLNYAFDWSVYDIERMMMKQGVSHDRKTLLAMFYAFAFGGQYESIKRRWRELSLSRVHRDRGLYTSLISILKEDHKEAIYALTVVRHQMSRESPPVEPDANLYKLLFDCCSLTKDTSATLDVLDALNTSNVQPTEAMHEALVKACLSAPRLIDRAMEVINRAKIQEISLTNATWEMMITHLLTKEKNVKEAKFTFNAYTSIRLLNRVPPSDWIRVMQAELESKKRK